MKRLFISILLLIISCLSLFCQTTKEDSLVVSGDSLFESFVIQYFREGYLLTEKQFINNKLRRLTTWKDNDTLINTLYSDKGMIRGVEKFVIKSRNDSCFTGYNENLYCYYLYESVEYNEYGVIVDFARYDFFYSKKKKRTVSLPLFSISYSHKGKPHFKYEFSYDEDLNSHMYKSTFR